MTGASEASGLPSCPTLDRPTPGAEVEIARRVTAAVEAAFVAMEALGVVVTEGAMVGSRPRVACRYCYERGAAHAVVVFQIDTPVGRFFAQTPEKLQHYGARPPDPLPGPNVAPRRSG